MATRQDSFEQIAMPHLRSLLRVARRLTLDPAAAEDLVQETFLLAWRGFHQFEPGTNSRAWLFRIMFNAFHAHGRKLQASAIMVPLSTREHEFSSGSRSYEAVEMAEALASLSTEHRTVLLLGVVEGFTCQEIAGILSLPLGTVMSRISRARQAMRKRLMPAESNVGCSAGEGI